MKPAWWWTERDENGRVYLCWYEKMSDPRESRSILTRTLIGRPTEREVWTTPPLSSGALALPSNTPILLERA